MSKSKSNLIREAVALLAADPRSARPFEVALIGYDNLDEVRFILEKGCRPTLIHEDPSKTRALSEQCLTMDVTPKPNTLLFSDISKIPDGKFDLLICEGSLNAFTEKDRSEVLSHFKRVTRVHGWLALRAQRDLSSTESKAERRYLLRARELLNYFRDCKVVDFFDGMIKTESAFPDFTSIIICQRTQDTVKPVGLAPEFFATILASGALALISFLLCTLGYTEIGGYAPASIWPGSVFQALNACAFGAWGIVGTIAAGFFTDLLKFNVSYATLGFIPADFIQAFVPAFFYRRLLTKGGWFPEYLNFRRFFVWGVLLPNLLGALCSSAVLSLSTGKALSPLVFDWLTSHIPIAVLLGWPMFRILLPAFLKEGWAIKGWWS